MRKTVLITGGKGYLGGRIASYLQDKGYDLKLGSRKSSENPEWLIKGEVVAMDFESDTSLDKVCCNADIIIHLAALNHIDCAQNPELALQVNVLGTLKLLQAAERAKVEKVIYFSTAHIYGVPLKGKISENTLPRPIHPYSLTHKAAEDYVLAANDCGSLTGLVVRLSNGFGYPMDANVNCWNLLVNDLCRQAVVDHRLVMQSSGYQRRDFVTLHDVQRASFHMLNMPMENIGEGVFNVGGSWAPRIIDMVELVQNRCSVMFGYTPEIVRPVDSASVSDFKLEYSVNKLLSSGFVLKGQPEDEIDKLLLLCKKVFEK